MLEFADSTNTTWPGPPQRSAAKGKPESGKLSKTTTAIEKSRGKNYIPNLNYKMGPRAKAGLGKCDAASTQINSPRRKNDILNSQMGHGATARLGKNDTSTSEMSPLPGKAEDFGGKDRSLSPGQKHTGESLRLRDVSKGQSKSLLRGKLSRSLSPRQIRGDGAVSTTTVNITNKNDTTNSISNTKATTPPALTKGLPRKAPVPQKAAAPLQGRRAKSKKKFKRVRRQLKQLRLLMVGKRQQQKEAKKPARFSLILVDKNMAAEDAELELDLDDVLISQGVATSQPATRVQELQSRRTT